MKKNKVIPVKILQDFASGDSMGQMVTGMNVLARESTAIEWIKAGRAVRVTTPIDDLVFARRFDQREVRPQHKAIETRAS